MHLSKNFIQFVFFSDSDVSHEAIKAAAKAVGSISDTDFDVRFNPDTHLHTVKHATSEVGI